MEAGFLSPEAFEALKAERIELSDSEQQLHKQYLKAVELMAKSDYHPAHTLLETLLPLNLDLNRRLGSFARKSGMEWNDCSYMTINTLMALMETNVHLGFFDDFDEYGKQASELAEKALTKDEQVRFSISLAHIRSSKQGLQEYIRKLEAGLAWFRSKKDYLSAYTCLLDTVDLYLSLSDTARAAAVIREAENLGLPVLPSPERTMELLEKELEGLPARQDYQLMPVPEMDVLSEMSPEELSEIAEGKRRHDEKVKQAFLKRCEELKQESESIREWSFFCNSQYRLNSCLLQIHYARGEYEDALRVSKSMKKNRFLQEPEVQSEVHFYSGLLKAMVLLKEGKGQECLVAVDELEMRKHPGKHLLPVPDRCLELLRRARAKALLALERNFEAFRLLEELYESKTLAGQVDTAVDGNLQLLLAEAAEKAGKLETSLYHYSPALTEVALKMRSPLGYRLDSTWIKGYERQIHSALTLCRKLNQGEEFLLLAEQFKARSLTSVLRSAVTVQTGFPEEASIIAEIPLVEEYDCLEKKMDYLDLEIYSGKLPPERTEQYKRERAAVNAQRKALLEKIRISDPRWRQLSEAEPIDIHELKLLLGRKRQAALEMYLTGNVCMTALITGDAVEIDSIDLGPIRDRLQFYVTNLSAENPDTQYYDLSPSLYIRASDLIPEKLLGKALECESLVISPNGFLHLLPWPALLHGGRRLFEYLPVAAIPNMSCLSYLDYEPDPRPKAILFGVPDYSGLQCFSPLKKGAEEVANLQKLYMGQSCLAHAVCSGKGAREGSLADLIRLAGKKSAILHIVCHGTIDPEEPMRSALILTDSILDASEISRISPCPSEVILSACSTGFRPSAVDDFEVVSDEVLGLPGAFLEAGAKTLLTSIPRANDAAAAKFMLLYHQFRLDGYPPMKAYQKTQLHLLQENLIPFKWTGFMLYGCV